MYCPAWSLNGGGERIWSKGGHQNCGSIDKMCPLSKPRIRMVFPLRTRIRAVQLQWELRSATRARSALALELGGVGVPPTWAIARWAATFDTTVAVQARPQTRGPHWLILSTLRAVRRANGRNPRLSERRLPRELRSATRARRALAL